MVQLLKIISLVSLADQLLQDPYKLMMLGMIRKNKKEIFKKFLHGKRQKSKMPTFCFNQKYTLSYMPNQNKLVLLLSTIHKGAETEKKLVSVQ